MTRTSLTAPLALLLALIVPQGALAAGGPVAPVQGSYIGVPGSPYRYAAFDATGNTVVKRQAAGARSAGSESRVSGHYGIPGVDYSGSTTGLSTDGRTLILAELTGHRPPRTTRLLVLDTASLAVRDRITLAGWSTVDAISPDGRWLYLIHYVSSDTSRYEVRAYDLHARRLLTKPVVDPRDHGEAMVGIPVNRVMSAGGRWAYTLYLRPSGVPFVHALDTMRRRAVCIDLPSLANSDIGSAHLKLNHDGAALQVDTGGVPRAVIDTRTFTVSANGGATPEASGRPVAPARRKTAGQGELPWALIVVSIAALCAVAGTGVARSRHQREYARGPDRAAFTDVNRQQTDRALADGEAGV